MVEPDPDPLLWQLLLQVFLILANALFACSEIAVISIGSVKLRRLSETGSKQAKRLLSLTKEPSNFLATIQVGITLAGFLGSAFAAENFARKLSAWLSVLNSPLQHPRETPFLYRLPFNIHIPLPFLETFSVIAVTVILSFITLVFGELIPKRVAMKKAEKISLAMSGVIFALYKFLTPLVWLLTVSTNAVLRLVGIDPTAGGEKITEEEIQLMVDAGSKDGSIDVEEKEYIQKVFNFDDITANKIMTHRTDVSMLWLEENGGEWDETIQNTRYSFYPVCDGSPDKIAGVLNTKDYFRLKERSRERIMLNAVKPPQLVPETARADVLLRNMQKNRNHFAVVLDEYGGMSGIITINDLLEQLVGDLDDGADSADERPAIEPIGVAMWRVSGTASLADVEKIMDMPLPCGEYDTFAGMVFGLLGNVPDDGSLPEVEGYGLHINVEAIRDHRLETATIRRID